MVNVLAFEVREVVKRLREFDLSKVKVLVLVATVKKNALIAGHCRASCQERLHPTDDSKNDSNSVEEEVVVVVGTVNTDDDSKEDSSKDTDDDSTRDEEAEGSITLSDLNAFSHQ